MSFLGLDAFFYHRQRLGVGKTEAMEAAEHNQFFSMNDEEICHAQERVEMFF